MKNSYLFIILTALTIQVSAQWQATNTSSLGNETVYHITEHNGSLFGAINSKGLIKWNGSSWDSVAVNGFTFNLNSIHIELLASSGNNLYAIVADQSCASRMVYKSTDNGANFVADTAGLPIFSCNNEVATIHNVFVLDGTLIVIMNTGNFSKKPADAAWVKNNSSTTEFAELWSEYNNTWYSFHGYKLHTSTDDGQNWTTPANTNLPTQFFAKVMNVNPDNGRIYVVGATLSQTEYRMLYSDNEGVSWDSLPINQYLGLDWINQKQKVIDMISKGDFMEVMLVNNSNGSHPDMLVSTDGGQTFSVDTVGLNSNSFGTTASRKMLIYNSELFAALNFNDVYKKALVVGVDESNTSIGGTSVFPNPSSGLFSIHSENKIEKIELFSIAGKKLLEAKGSKKQLDITEQPNGIYFVITTTVKGNQSVNKVIKN